MPDTLAKRLQQLAGLDSAAAAELVNAVIRVLTEQLPARDRATFVEKLPPEMRRAHRPAGAPCDSAELFYKSVAALAGLPVAHATEASQVVCAALVDLIDAETRVWLEARLPPALTTLFASRAVSSRPADAPHAQRRSATLADGQPGSTHPLAEARAERAHHNSIARSPNPHGETKLSSGSGPTQSREHETLADADPRPARSLSNAKQ